MASMLEEAERQPVLVVWEDLHWAAPSTLENLGLLLDQSRTSAMLNLLTFRAEFVPSWPSRSHITPLTLNRLERPQVEALITHLAGGKALYADQSLAGVEEALLQERLASWSTPSCSSSGASAGRQIFLQACPGAGCGVCLLAEEHAAAVSPAGGPDAGGPLPQHGRDRV
jgi:hypothetical protein